MLAGIVIAVLSLCTYGYFTNYTLKANVVGYLNPQSGGIAISAPIGGQLILEKQNGDAVTKGELIARVRNINLGAEGQSVQAIEAEGIEDGINLAKSRLALIENQAVALKSQQDAAFAQFKEQARASEEQLESLKSALKVAQEEETRTQNLVSQKLATKPALAQAQQSVLNAQQTLNQAQSAVNELPNRENQLKLDWQSRALDLEQNRNSIERDLRALEAQLLQTGAQNEAGIFAPADGVLTFSQAQNEQFISPGTPLFQITPKSSQLVAVLLAPSSAVGFAKPGDVAQIRYQAFPFRENGVFEGEIINIDDTAQLPSAINAPIQVNEPVYRVVLKIDQEPTSKSGKQLNLSPGMVLDASIIINKKPILFWLFDPVMG